MFDAGSVANRRYLAIARPSLRTPFAAMSASEVDDGRQLFRVAFAQAPIGMALVASDGQLLQVNAAFCALFEDGEAHLLTRTLQDLLQHDDLLAFLANIGPAIAGETSSFQEDIRFTRRDGEVVWVQMNVSPLREPAGTPRALVAHVQEITARKAVEATAAAAHADIQQVLERISDAFYALDREWRFTYINEAAELLLGRTREDLLGKVLWEEFPPIVQTPLYAAYHRALTHGVTVSLEVYYPPWDGWGEGQIYPSPDGISVFFHEVTARKRLEEELRASEARYRALVEQLPGAVYLLAADENETPLYVSPYFETHMGIQVAGALARTHHWLAYVHPDDRARVAAEDARIREAGEPFRLEYRHARGDGSYMWVQDECVPVHDDTGQLIAWQGVMVDITPRVHAQQALVASETRFRTAFADAPIGMALLTFEGRIVQANQALSAMLGYPAAELIGMLFQDIIHPDEVAPSLDRLGTLMAGERESYEGEKRQIRKDGEVRWAHASVSLVRDDAGLPSYIIAQVLDTTERKRSVDELREALEAAHVADRARSQFVAMMSHELRTPMQAVLGYSEMLHAQLADHLTPEQHDDFAAIHQGGRRVVGLVNDLLDLSRLNAGRLELNRELVELGPILEQVRQDVSPQVKRKKLTLSIALQPRLPTVHADPTRLRQILLNLVGNAVKFTDNGSVHISATTSEAGVTVTVTDTGIGMAPESLPLIFEEFYQASDGTSRRAPGAGLGLAIARKLAEQHGGRITVISEPTAGSTFTLELPVVRPIASRTKRRRAR